MIQNSKATIISIILTGCLLMFVTRANAQWYDPDKVSKKAGEIYAKAYEDAQDDKLDAAIEKINKAIQLEPRFVDAYLSRAGIYANQKKYDLSVADFEKALQMDSVYSESYRLPYSISLAGKGQFAKALDAINLFLSIPTLNNQSKKAGEYRKRIYEFALAYEKQHPNGDYVFAPINLGDSINSKDLEYYPSITIDGKHMVFTRRIGSDEDFYESNSVNGVWSNAEPLGGKVNTNLNEGAQNISQDGQWIVFTGCNYPEGVGSCDLYISYKTKNGWSRAENLGPTINTGFWESSPSLSPDKKDLYFSSDRPDGYGGRDIWVTHRNPNGRWTTPENLGPEVNSSGDESCSFMYADNQTLFFNSTGHQGYGNADLFFCKKINDSTWSDPINLGYPINTIDEEGSLIVAADGQTAYYASDKADTKGGLDLYSFKLRKDIQPPKTLWVSGQVYDAQTKSGLPSSVELTDINTRQVISRVQTDENGYYLATLPIGREYAFNVNRKGYLFYSENYNLSNQHIDSVFNADIPLQSLKSGAKVILKNIFFDTRETKLKPASIVELDKIIQLMVDNPNLRIMINGHTDNVGKAADNLTLSVGRAKAVVTYLLASRKIAKERLVSKGSGATLPISDNNSENGRALNRRTELSVISN